MQSNSPQVKIDLREQPSVVCEKCGGELFREVTMIKKVSKFITGSSQDSNVPFPTYCCDSCGHVNEEFLVFNDGQ